MKSQEVRPKITKRHPSAGGKYTAYHALLAEALVKAEEARGLIAAAASMLTSPRDKSHFEPAVKDITHLIGHLEHDITLSYADSVQHMPDLSQ